MTVLAEVARRGAPAQQDQARRLMATLPAGGPEADEAARALVAAYLHDPHLDRG